MNQKLRIVKKKHKGIFASNSISIKIHSVESDADLDAFLDVFDAHYGELVPFVTSTALRKAYRTNQPVIVEAATRSPDSLRHDGYVAYHNRDGTVTMTFSGPSYVINRDTEQQIVERLREITEKNIVLSEESSDTWYD